MIGLATTCRGPQGDMLSGAAESVFGVSTLALLNLCNACALRSHATAVRETNAAPRQDRQCRTGHHERDYGVDTLSR